MFETVWQISLIPRWLLYSGLPQALGPTRWAVFAALVQLDHQTAGLPTRRRGADAAAFVAPQRDVVAATGYSESSVRRALVSLARTDLLSVYRPGGGRQEGAGGAWCTFGIERTTMLRLAEYVMPRIMPMHGGVRGLSANELPGHGLHVYGWRDDPVVLSTDKLFRLAYAGDEPEEPELEQIIEICGLPVQNTVENLGRS